MLSPISNEFTTMPLLSFNGALASDGRASDESFLHQLTNLLHRDFSSVGEFKLTRSGEGVGSVENIMNNLPFDVDVESKDELFAKLSDWLAAQGLVGRFETVDVSGTVQAEQSEALLADVMLDEEGGSLSQTSPDGLFLSSGRGDVDVVSASYGELARLDLTVLGSEALSSEVALPLNNEWVGGLSDIELSGVNSMLDQGSDGFDRLLVPIVIGEDAQSVASFLSFDISTNTSELTLVSLEVSKDYVAKISEFLGLHVSMSEGLVGDVEFTYSENQEVFSALNPVDLGLGAHGQLGPDSLSLSHVDSLAYSAHVHLATSVQVVGALSGQGLSLRSGSGVVSPIPAATVWSSVAANSFEFSAVEGMSPSQLKLESGSLMSLFSQQQFDKTVFFQQLHNLTQREVLAQAQQEVLRQGDATSAERFDLLADAGGEAGAVGGDKKSSLPSLASVNYPLRHPQWGNAVAKRVVFMATHQLQMAQITLNPEKLGPIQIRLQMDREQLVAVSMSAHHGATREALEQAIPKLKEMLEQAGIEYADVQVDDQSDFGEGLSDAQTQSSGAKLSAQSLNQNESDGEQVDQKPLKVAELNNMVDFYV